MSSNPVLTLGRRHFLKGAGGFALAIPFLPSLERVARAGDGGSGTPVVPPRYFYVCTDHGGCWDQNYFPANPAVTMTKTVTGVPGHTVGAAALAPTTSGSTTSVSQVLQASSSVFTPSLVAKMNVLRGLDVPWYLAHNTGLLGNFARNDGSGQAGQDGYSVAQLGQRPTIDQIMAGSRTFYTSAILASTKAQSVTITGPDGYGHSFGFSTAGDVNSSVVPLLNTQGSLALFQSIFGVTTGTPPPPRKSAIDLVLGTFNNLMSGTGSNRISAADKLRLAQHVDMLSTLESSLDATLACSTTPTPPADNSNYGVYANNPNYGKWGQLYMDVIAAAFACNASRVSSFGFGDTSNFSSSWNATGQSDWHHLSAHCWFQEIPQGWLAQSYQGFFEQVFLYLAAKLDGLQDADGRTVLDNSLLVWGQECCMETHEQYGIQTSTFGSAGGAINTGLYCDYRRQNETACERMPGAAQTGLGPVAPAIMDYVTWPGLLWEQWLATQLVAMGIPNNQWELWKDSTGAVQQGYGTPYLQQDAYGLNFQPHYQPNAPTWAGGSPTVASSAYYQNASSPLPFIMKS